MRSARLLYFAEYDRQANMAEMQPEKKVVAVNPWAVLVIVAAVVFWASWNLWPLVDFWLDAAIRRMFGQ